MIPNGNGGSDFRGKVAAWLPVLQGYGTFSVGLGGIVIQLVVFATTKDHFLSLFALGVCGLLCGRPDQFVPFIMQYLGIRRKE